MQSDEQEIRQLVATWMAASKAGDVETVLSLMADDVVFLVPGQPVMRKADFAAAARAQSGPGAPRFDGTSEIQEIQVCRRLGLPVDPAHRRGDPARRRKPMTRAGHTLSILKKRAEVGAGTGREFVVSGVKAGEHDAQSPIERDVPHQAGRRPSYRTVGDSPVAAP